MDEQNVRGLLQHPASIKSQVSTWKLMVGQPAKMICPVGPATSIHIHQMIKNFWRYQFDQAWIFLKDGDQWWSMMFNGD